MAGIHYTILLIKKFKISKEVILPGTTVEIWNHGNKTKIQYKHESKGCIQELIDKPIEIFKKIIEKSA